MVFYLPDKVKQYMQLSSDNTDHIEVIHKKPSNSHIYLKKLAQPFLVCLQFSLQEGINSNQLSPVGLRGLFVHLEAHFA